MQNTFLSEVAQQLYNRYGDDISSLTIVVPTRRARLFLSEAFSNIAQRPLWQPEYMSMDDIMRSASDLKIGNRVRIISELYKIYSKYHKETFDVFYSWGETLLGDFNLIDNYMIDADMLFRNIYDLKVLEADLDYLTPEMRSIIHSFWKHFEDEITLKEEKQKFLAIWLTLAKVYHELKDRLSELGIAYQGMLYRAAADNINSGKCLPATSRHYVFVGFNALSKSEQCILNYLKVNAECDFFWDYDNYYTDNTKQEAGRFMRENIKTFTPSEGISHDNFATIKKDMTAISTVSEITQCKYLPTLLKELSENLELDKETAIILTDESLLMPLLHSLPKECANNINVTMGHPLRNTTAYSFIDRLISLQKKAQISRGEVNFYHADVTGLLMHPYIINAYREAESLSKDIVKNRMVRVRQSMFADKGELLRKIFFYADSWQELAKSLIDIISTLINAESNNNDEDVSIKASYLSALSTGIEEIANCLNLCDIELDTSTFILLLHRHLPTIRIPFSGEPLQGMQIMGILETRALDFKNVIILSMNENNFPGIINKVNSAIPNNLRIAYGIPTPDHHESVYAYYFYRLIQRAERVDLVYCSHNGESDQSRYIRQLEYESPYPIKRINIGVDIKAEKKSEIEIEKSDEIMEKLNQYLDPQSGRSLYPTAFSNFIDCPLRFYLQNIAKLKVQDELEDNIDNRIFGNILHSAMEFLYQDLKDVIYTEDDLNLLLKNNKVESAVEQAIKKDVANNQEIDKAEYSGNLQLISEIIIKYIRDYIIPFDKKQKGVVFRGFEGNYHYKFPLGDGREVNIAGKADRLDSLGNGNLRIVDYKTGKKHDSISRIADLFDGPKRSGCKNILQTIMYSMVLFHSQNRNVTPALYYIKEMYNPTFTPNVVINKQEVDYESYKEEFENALREKLKELFNKDIPFRQCGEDEAKKTCNYCNFKTICKRESNDNEQ